MSTVVELKNKLEQFKQSGYMPTGGIHKEKSEKFNCDCCQKKVKEINYWRRVEGGPFIQICKNCVPD